MNSVPFRHLDEIPSVLLTCLYHRNLCMVSCNLIENEYIFHKNLFYSLYIERVSLRIFSLISLNIFLRSESIPMRLLVRGLFFTNKFIYSIYYGRRKQIRQDVQSSLSFVKRVIVAEIVAIWLDLTGRMVEFIETQNQ